MSFEVWTVKLVSHWSIEESPLSWFGEMCIMQVYDLRKILVSYYIKAIIYYTVRSPRLQVQNQRLLVYRHKKASVDFPLSRGVCGYFRLPLDVPIFRFIEHRKLKNWDIAFQWSITLWLMVQTTYRPIYIFEIF